MAKCEREQYVNNIILTAWPRDNGWMSKNARTLSDSKSLKDGMSPSFEQVSPIELVQLMQLFTAYL